MTPILTMNRAATLALALATATTALVAQQPAPPQPAQPALGLSVPHPLLAGRGTLRGGGAATAGSGPAALGGLSFSGLGLEKRKTDADQI